MFSRNDAAEPVEIVGWAWLVQQPRHYNENEGIVRETGNGGYGISDISRALHFPRAKVGSVDSRSFCTDGHGDGAAQYEKPGEHDDDQHRAFVWKEHVDTTEIEQKCDGNCERKEVGDVTDPVAIGDRSS